MMEQAMELTVRKAVTVEASPERAFEVFTTGFGDWWPSESHTLSDGPATPVMETGAGGRWYERAADGTEREWGRVVDWEPPERVLLAWHLDPKWEYDPDPERATEVEVRFTEEASGATRVELEHRGFERLGEGGRQISASVGSEGGWSSLLDAYAAEITA